ncbi:transposase family protein [Streptacidiphilus rugosus]|uniref:transposase family protein n=1 Tax=Streptacidiphilus rugosus TaxID=405783 RepID=UPI0012FC97A8|nr:transposase family protein [Streptacidiphilus rugosus]
MCRQFAAPCSAPVRRLAWGTGLVDRLSSLPDPRDRRGQRHPLVSVLLVAASAVLAGARSFRAIGQGAAAAPQHTLSRLGAGRRRSRRVPRVQYLDDPPGHRHRLPRWPGRPHPAATRSRRTPSRSTATAAAARGTVIRPPPTCSPR